MEALSLINPGCQSLFKTNFYPNALKSTYVLYEIHHVGYQNPKFSKKLKLLEQTKQKIQETDNYIPIYNFRTFFLSCYVALFHITLLTEKNCNDFIYSLFHTKLVYNAASLSFISF